MSKNENIIRELYAAAEASSLDTEKFVSMFSPQGYMRDVPSGKDLRGPAIANSIAGLAKAFPDLHRELLSVHSSGDFVVVELAIRGIHQNDLVLGSTTLAATGKKIDVPSCDVFRLVGGKITSFHCYNAATVMQRQLGVGQQ